MPRPLLQRTTTVIEAEVGVCFALGTLKIGECGGEAASAAGPDQPHGCQADTDAQASRAAHAPTAHRPAAVAYAFWRSFPPLRTPAVPAWVGGVQVRLAAVARLPHVQLVGGLCWPPTHFQAPQALRSPPHPRRLHSSWHLDSGSHVPSVSSRLKVLPSALHAWYLMPASSSSGMREYCNATGAG